MNSFLTPRHLALLALTVLFIGLSTGKALLSISTVALAVAAAWDWLSNGRPAFRTRERRTVAWMLGIWLLALISGLWTADTARWAADVYGKLPLLLIPLAIYILPFFSIKEWDRLKLLFLATQFLVAAGTMLQFAGTFEEQLQRVAENSHIEILGGLSHIYFGLLLGWSVLLGLWLWRGLAGVGSSVLRWVILLMTLFNAIALHVLVSRTGLLSFYVAMAGFGGLWLWQERQRILLLGLAGLMILSPVLAFYAMPSFRLRVEVTHWDWEQYQREEADLSNNSLSMRLLAWKASWGIVREHPLLGVGIEDVGQEMRQQYRIQGLEHRAENLLTNPHNQYLKQWAGAGIAGLLVLLLAVAQPLWEFRRRIPPLVAGFALLMIVAMCFESVLERQIGMTFFALMSMMLLQEE